MAAPVKTSSEQGPAVRILQHFKFVKDTNQSTSGSWQLSMPSIDGGEAHTSGFNNPQPPQSVAVTSGLVQLNPGLPPVYRLGRPSTSKLEEALKRRAAEDSDDDFEPSSFTKPQKPAFRPAPMKRMRKMAPPRGKMPFSRKPRRAVNTEVPVVDLCTPQHLPESLECSLEDLENCEAVLGILPEPHPEVEGAEPHQSFYPPPPEEPNRDAEVFHLHTPPSMGILETFEEAMAQQPLHPTPVEPTPEEPVEATSAVPVAPNPDAEVVQLRAPPSRGKDISMLLSQDTAETNGDDTDSSSSDGEGESTFFHIAIYVKKKLWRLKRKSATRMQELAHEREQASTDLQQARSEVDRWMAGLEQAREEERRRLARCEAIDTHIEDTRRRVEKATEMLRRYESM